jgi:protein tyrosine phosphatase (PTP) superfamily phosphohydrolase (DUF442 family)
MQVTERIYSGGEPETDEAFGELTTLGVKTIVSVDGALPNVERARSHGLRYVHIPIGYNGVPEEAGLALARLVREAEGPFYIHCHHGKHRGQAAAAVACVASGAAEGKTALRVLTRAGTSENYAGLWRDVEAYRPPAADAALPELVEIAQVDSLAAAMAQIDRATDNLKLCQTAGWDVPPEHPDIVAKQEALLLKEGFRETVRQLSAANARDEQFLVWMQDANQAAESLEGALTAGDLEATSARFMQMQRQCSRCHKSYRD